jgi:hypothetical protein
MSAALPADAVIQAVHTKNDTSAAHYELDFSEGAGGAEVVVTTTHLQGSAMTVGGDRYSTFAIASDTIASGSRLSIRCRTSIPVGVDVTVGVVYNPDYEQRGFQQFTVPATSVGIAVAANTTAWAYSAWGTITSPGLLGDYAITGFWGPGGVSNAEQELQIGQGAAASEVVATTLAIVTNGSGGTKFWILPGAPFKVDATTRLAYRFRKSGTTAGNDTFGLLYAAVLFALPTVTDPDDVRAPYDDFDQQTTLRATVTDSVTIDDGTVTFVVSGEALGVIGVPVQGDVDDGVAISSFTIPGGTPVGFYTIYAFYSGVDGSWEPSVGSGVLEIYIPSDREELCRHPQEPFIFASVAPPGLTRKWYGQVALPHRASYYGGMKPDRILGASSVQRSLAGWQNDYVVGTFTLTLADDDYEVRTMLVNDTGRFFSRWEVDMYMATPSGMKALAVPQTIATGQVDSDPTFDTEPEGMTVELSMRDRLGVAMGWTNTGQTQLPRRAVSNTTLPGVGVNMAGKAAWLPWGVLSTALVTPSGFAPPYPAVNPARGGAFDGPYALGSYAPWDQTVPPVTGLSVNAIAGGDCPDRTWAVAVFPFMNDNRVGDSEPYIIGDVQVATVSPNSLIDVAWTGTADRYYVCLFHFYFGWRLQQVIETTALTAQFNHAMDLPGGPGTGLSDGAVIPPDPTYNYYKARSVAAGPIYSAWHTVVDPTLPDYTLPNAPAQFTAGITLPNGAKRPSRLYWTSLGSGINLQIEKTAAGPGFTPRQFDVLASQLEDGMVYWDEDWNDNDANPVDATVSRAAGRLKVEYTRDVLGTDGVTRREFFIAGVPIKGVDNWYYDPDPNGNDPSVVEVDQDDGTVWWFPKVETSAWDTLFGTRYRDIIGTDGVTRRFMLGYGLGEKADLVASGTSRMTLNIQGIEDIGDCSGEVITDLHMQALHFLNHFVVASGEGYTTGLWGPVPTQGYDGRTVVNQSSFQEVKEMRDAEIEGGIVGAGVTGARGEFVDVSTELKRWMVSGDFRLGPNRDWQIVCRALNTAISPLLVPNSLNDVFDIHNRTFKPIPRMNELQNLFTYRSSRDYIQSGWLVDDQEYMNQDSVDNWRIRKRGEDLDFSYIEDPAVVAHIFGKHVARRKDVPMYATFEGDLCLYSDEFDIGRYVKLTHWRGVGVAGWVDRVMWILSQTFNPATKRVAIEALDVTPIISDDTALLEGAAMDIDLGGSWYHAPTVDSNPATVNAYEYRDRQYPWSKVPDGTTLTARVYCAVPSGVTASLQIYDPDNATVIATDPTTFTYTDGSFALHTFQLPSVTLDTVYRLRATITGVASGLSVVPFLGALRPTLP